MAPRREQRSFGHWDKGKPPRRIDGAAPKRGASRAPPPELAGPSTFRSASLTPASGPEQAAAPRRAATKPDAKQRDRSPAPRGRADEGRADAPDDSLRARLQAIAARREGRDTMRDPALTSDAEQPRSAAEATRASLRRIAELRFAERDGAELTPLDREEMVWQRVVELARPWLNQPGDDTAR